MYWNFLMAIFGRHIEVEGLGSFNVLLDAPSIPEKLKCLTGKLWMYSKPDIHNGSHSIEKNVNTLDEATGSIFYFFF